MAIENLHKIEGNFIWGLQDQQGMYCRQIRFITRVYTLKI